MKYLFLKAFVLVLLLCAQVLAQRFITIEPDVFNTGYTSLGPTTGYTGYFPGLKQIAALGEKNSGRANLMLIGGRDTSLTEGHESVGTYNVVNSHGDVLGIVYPLKVPNIFTLDGNEIHDNSATALVVLDSLNDSKNTATVLFASLKKLIIMRITIDSASSISDSILGSRDMPAESMWEVDGNYVVSQNSGTYTRRLALLGISQSGTSKTYHLATGNPYGKSGTREKSGRVDFFNITENSWALSQPNANGLAHGINGLVIGENYYFGKDLAVIDNFDKNGGKALAVLLSASAETYPNSALYIFKMDNDWTPNTELPIMIAGAEEPWLESPEQIQNCGGLGVANWGDETTHLLVSCQIRMPGGNDGDISNIIIVKDIVLDSTGNILNSSILSSEKISAKIPAPYRYNVYSNPIAIKNHKNDLHSISLAVIRNYSTVYHYMAIFTIMDADYSKNFSIEAGKREIIANIDSLFYRSGTKDFSAKTLFGSVDCKIENGNLSCLGGEKAIDSWSSIELSGDCVLGKVCKRKDTIFVHVYPPNRNPKPSTALRIPKDIVVPYSGQVNLNDLKSRSYFKNPDLQSTSISWDTGIKLNVSGDLEKGLSITPLSNSKEGIDTLIFTLSIGRLTKEYHLLRLHIADTSKVLYNGIPANPGNDTVWNTGEKKYIALPLSNTSGNIYTYDIVQDSLDKNYAEIIGDYLHIITPEVVDISIAYTENGQIKYRKVSLRSEEKPVPIVAGSFTQNLNFVHINGGLQINGLNGEIELRAYNLKGVELQREKINAQGSVFVKFKQNCPQIVQIKSANKKFYLKVTGQN